MAKYTLKDQKPHAWRLDEDGLPVAVFLKQDLAERVLDLLNDESLISETLKLAQVLRPAPPCNGS